MRFILMFVLVLTFFIGCSNTWNGVKEDTINNVDWSKSKINQSIDWSKSKIHKGADWVGNKTKN